MQVVERRRLSQSFPLHVCILLGLRTNTIRAMESGHGSLPTVEMALSGKDQRSGGAASFKRPSRPYKERGLQKRPRSGHLGFPFGCVSTPVCPRIRGQAKGRFVLRQGSIRRTTMRPWLSPYPCCYLLRGWWRFWHPGTWDMPIGYSMVLC